MSRFYLPMLMRSLRLRERHVVAVQAFLMGLAGALAALLFEAAADAVQYLYTGFWGGRVACFEQLPPLWRLLLPAVGAIPAALVLWVALKRAKRPMPEYMEAFSLGSGRLPRRQGLLRSISAVLSLGSGACIGKEGALMQISAVAASAVGRWLQVSAPRLRLMVGCGAVAGMTAAFHTPLAACLFVCEVLVGTFSIGHLAPLLAAGCAAYSLLWLLGDTGALFASDVVFGSFTQVAWCALLGVLMALGGRLWVAWLNLARRVLNGRPAWVLPRMVLAGIAVGLAAWWQPHIVGNGQESIAALVGGQLGDTQQIAVLLGLKALLVAVVFGVGTMGGVLTPTLMLGCFGGYLFGVLTGAAEPLPYALVGTAAFFAVASRSPITALILVIELTLDAALIFPLMVAVAAAYATARLLPAGSLYDASVGGAADSPFEGGLAGMTVAEIMHRAPACLHTTVPAAGVARALTLHAGEGIPVTTPNGCYAGMLYELTSAATAGEMMQTDIRPLSPADDIPAALAVFSRTPSRCAALPVTDPATGRLCGLVSRAELYQTAALLLRKELAHPLPYPAKA